MLNKNEKREKKKTLKRRRKRTGGKSLFPESLKIIHPFQKESFLRRCLTMFPENWNHPKIKTRLFPLCLFRRDKLPRQVHPAEMIIRGKPLEHLWAPAPHCVRLSSLIDTNLSATPPLVLPQLLCSSMPNCGTGLFRQKKLP